MDTQHSELPSENVDIILKSKELDCDQITTMDANPHSESADISMGSVNSEVDETKIGHYDVIDHTPQFSKAEVNPSEYSTATLEGRRIVNIKWMFESMQRIANHSVLCSLDDIEFVKEVRRGLLSIFYFKCKMCKEALKFGSEEVIAEKMDVNLAMISGAVSVGNGYSQMQEITAVADIPFMSSDLYKTLHGKIHSAWMDTALDEMKKAADEEKQMAFDAGEVDIDGFPEVTVAVDGAWSKRSYRTNYNALAGVAAIVGVRTKKVLFMAVRNKYCTVCHKAIRDKTKPRQHNCGKNFSGSSTSMEADIIVEGFTKSIEMYGIKYTRFVGDGDSSVFRKLTDHMPYAPRSIVKIECSNHLLRNYCTNLKNDIWECRGPNKPGTPQLRQVVKSKVIVLRSAVVGAVRYRKQQTDMSFHSRVEELKKDIKNSPFHVFGDHDNCRNRDGGYFCKEKKPEINMIPDLMKGNVLEVIQKSLNRLCIHAESLIYGFHSNSVETYNSIIAKLTGGKRCNFSLGRSYEARSAGAVISYNTQSLHSKVHRKLFNTSPAKILKNLEEKRARWNMTRRKHIIGSKSKKYQLTQGSDSDYGVKVIRSNNEMEEQKENFLKELTLDEKQIHEVERSTVDQADSWIWKQERAKRLTASNFGRVCNMRLTTDGVKAARSILMTDIGHLSQVAYGRSKEKVAICEAEKVLGCTVKKCGLFVDKTNQWLAASPDGLVNEDSIIEVKCPSSAYDSTPVDAVINKTIKCCILASNNEIKLKPRHAYMFQIQGQLHITNKEFCYFVIWTPKGISIEKIYKDDTFWEEKMYPKLKKFFMDSMLPLLITEF